MARSENGKNHDSENMATENILRINRRARQSGRQIKKDDHNHDSCDHYCHTSVLAHCATFTGSPSSFRLVGYVTIAIAVLFLGLGIRQWLVLSKWTNRYRHYKEMQKKIDEKLDFENESEK